MHGEQSLRSHLPQDLGAQRLGCTQARASPAMLQVAEALRLDRAGAESESPDALMTGPRGSGGRTACSLVGTHGTPRHQPEAEGYGDSVLASQPTVPSRRAE